MFHARPLLLFCSVFDRRCGNNATWVCPVMSQVMREFPEPDAFEVDPNPSLAQRGTRKRHRPVNGTHVNFDMVDGASGPHQDNGNGNGNDNHSDGDLADDAWLADEGAGDGGAVSRWKEPPFSPAQVTSAKSAAIAAAKMAEARADPPTLTHTPDSRAAQPPGRKRARVRPSVSSPSPSPSPAATTAVAVGGTSASSSFRKLGSPKTLSTSGAGESGARSMESPHPRWSGHAGRKQGARSGRGSHIVGSSGGSSSSSSSDSGRPGGDGEGHGGGGGVVGDEAGWASRDGVGVGVGVEDGFRVAVAVTPQENSLNLNSNIPPPDPSLMRECLDEYMEVRRMAPALSKTIM